MFSQLDFLQIGMVHKIHLNLPFENLLKFVDVEKKPQQNGVFLVAHETVTSCLHRIVGLHSKTSTMK